MDEEAQQRYEHNRRETERVSRATAVYAGLATAGSVASVFTTGVWRWVFIGLAALFAAITAWMLLFVIFIGWVARRTRPS